jgi:uncharacterized protein (DUF2225 family)
MYIQEKTYSYSNNIGYKKALYLYASHLYDECNLGLSNTVPIDEESSYEVANDAVYGNSYFLVDFTGAIQAIITNRLAIPPQKHAVVLLGV